MKKTKFFIIAAFSLCGCSFESSREIISQQNKEMSDRLNYCDTHYKADYYHFKSRTICENTAEAEVSAKYKNIIERRGGYVKSYVIPRAAIRNGITRDVLMKKITPEEALEMERMEFAQLNNVY